MLTGEINNSGSDTQAMKEALVKLLDVGRKTICASYYASASSDEAAVDTKVRGDENDNHQVRGDGWSL